MTTNSAGTNPSVSVGARTATTLNLKTLKTPAEGGTKKEYEDFWTLSKLTFPSIGILDKI